MSSSSNSPLATFSIKSFADRNGCMSEVSHVLSRRHTLSDLYESGVAASKYTECFVSLSLQFPEFSIKQIQDLQQTFNAYAVASDGLLDLTQLNLMMEKLDAAQTHLGLKKMVEEVDDNKDGRINFREFLVIWRKVQGYATPSEINVREVGVRVAKKFFENKIEEQTRSIKLVEEIKQKQLENQRAREENLKRRLEFQALVAKFK